MFYIAHAGESHPTAVSNTTHFLESWYIALPLFFIVAACITLAAYYAFKRSVAAAFLSLTILLLVGGVYFYDKVAIISILSITIGFGMCLFGVLAGLLSPKGQ